MNRIKEKKPRDRIFNRIFKRIQYTKFKYGFSKVCRKCSISANKETKLRNAFFCKNCESLAINHYKQTGKIRFPFTMKFR